MTSAATACDFSENLGIWLSNCDLGILPENLRIFTVSDSEKITFCDDNDDDKLYGVQYIRNILHVKTFCI